MIRSLKTILLASFVYCFTFGLLAAVSIFVPYPYFSSFLTISAVFSIFFFAVVFSLAMPRRSVAFAVIFFLGFLTAYFPLGLPMSDDRSFCPGSNCGQLHPDLASSYFLVRGLPFVWQGYASLVGDFDGRLIYAPFSDLGRYQGNWWQPVAFWPNLFLNIFTITLPANFFVFFRSYFYSPQVDKKAKKAYNI